MNYVVIEQYITVHEAMLFSTYNVYCMVFYDSQQDTVVAHDFVLTLVWIVNCQSGYFYNNIIYYYNYYFSSNILKYKMYNII